MPLIVCWPLFVLPCCMAWFLCVVVVVPVDGVFLGVLGRGGLPLGEGMDNE